MYKHHEESIKCLVDYFKDDDEVLAVILDGSVAKGCARPDSDIDAMIVVTPERLARQIAQNRHTECISGYCTYEGGYFDLKYCDKNYLEAAAQGASEPTRSAFEGAVCEFSRDTEIPPMVAKIGVFQKQEAADKMLSFYSAYNINRGYFWDMSRDELDNRFLRVEAAANIVLYGLRMLLEENEVFFPCQKSLFKAVSRLEINTQKLLGLANTLLEKQDDKSKLDFEAELAKLLLYCPPSDNAELLTRFVDDNEQWWYRPRPNVPEW